jgi:hypothetical protein
MINQRKLEKLTKVAIENLKQEGIPAKEINVDSVKEHLMFIADQEFMKITSCKDDLAKNLNSMMGKKIEFGVIMYSPICGNTEIIFNIEPKDLEKVLNKLLESLKNDDYEKNTIKS